MNISLTRPTLEHQEKALNYRKEHFNNGEMIINGSERLDKIDSYEEWLEKVTRNSNPETVDPSWVVTDTFFAINNKTN